jgi:hypothetical protein
MIIGNSCDLELDCRMSDVGFLNCWKADSGLQRPGDMPSVGKIGKVV